jgi:acetolactate synthase-1/2/3 large subunit
MRRNTVFIGDVGTHRIESFLMPIYEGERCITTSYVLMELAV